MSAWNSLQLQSSSPAETAALAERIAPQLGPGDCLLLEGGIGSGKTHFARALIQARLSAADRLEDVPSPTFTLVQTYSDGQNEIWHADLYRLTSAEEVDELGLTDAFATAICLVEWPDRLQDAVPGSALRLAFEYGQNDQDRIVTLSARDGRWKPVLDGLSQRAAPHG